MILNHRSLGQGPPVVVLHGLFGSLDNWISVGKQLAANYSVYLVDLRNHGNSFHGDEFTYTAMAGDISQLVNELKIDPISIIGHSMGGKVGMFYTVLNENFVKKLIVVDIAPRHYPVHHQRILDGLSAIDVNTITSRSQADDVLRSYVPDEGTRQFLLKNLKRNSSGSFEWKINLPVIRDQIENVGESLPESPAVQVSTLFIKGGGSDYISGEDHQDIHHRFANVKIQTIPGAGHWVHAEAPRAFLKSVNEFLG